MARTVDFLIATAADFARVDALLKACYPRLLAPAYHPGRLAPALPLMAHTNRFGHEKETYRRLQLMACFAGRN